MKIPTSPKHGDKYAAWGEVYQWVEKPNPNVFAVILRTGPAKIAEWVFHSNYNPRHYPHKCPGCGGPCFQGITPASKPDCVIQCGYPEKLK